MSIVEVEFFIRLLFCLNAKNNVFYILRL